MKQISVVQFQLQRNRETIQVLEDVILQVRREKSQADKAERIDDEYECHDALKKLRKELKGYVASQKLLKKLLKG